MNTVLHLPHSQQSRQGSVGCSISMSEHLTASKRGLEETILMDSERRTVATESVMISNREDNQRSLETKIRSEVQMENHEPESVHW